MVALICSNMFLALKNVKKRFGGVEAIKGSTFEIEKGKITALIGPNGAGKTTLFNIITGFVRPDSGSVVFEGRELLGRQPHTIAELGISRTFQQVRLFKYLSILEHLRMVDDSEDRKIWKNMFCSHRINKKPYRELLETFGIERSLDALVSELSYGQRKLLDIAMRLRMNHKLLLLDEPVAGVNAVVQERIENLLLELKKQGETILLIDHDMTFVRRLADYVIALDAGVVIAEGTPRDVLSDARVLEAYLGE